MYDLASNVQKLKSQLRVMRWPAADFPEGLQSASWKALLPLLAFVMIDYSPRFKAWCESGGLAGNGLD